MANLTDDARAPAQSPGYGAPSVTALSRSASWSKENLGVIFERRAYTNRECAARADIWSCCVEDGKLTLLAREDDRRSSR